MLLRSGISRRTRTSRWCAEFCPKSLENADIQKVAYLSVDLNNSLAERGVIERLWPKMATGGMVLLDDYGSRGFTPQHDMWNEFARSVNRRIMTIPTAQGLLIK